MDTAGRGLTTAPLAFRRTYPITAFCLILAAIIATHGTYSNALTFAAAIFAAYCAVAYSPYRRASMLCVLAAAIIVTALYPNTTPPVPERFTAVLVLIPTVAVGIAIRVWRRRANESAERLRRAQQEHEAETCRAIELERAHIASEMHDVVTHNVSVMVVQAGAARRVLDSSPGEAREALLAVEASGRTAMTELRHLLGLLAPLEEREPGAGGAVGSGSAGDAAGSGSAGSPVSSGSAAGSGSAGSPVSSGSAGDAAGSGSAGSPVSSGSAAGSGSGVDVHGTSRQSGDSGSPGTSATSAVSASSGAAASEAAATSGAAISRAAAAPGAAATPWAAATSRAAISLAAAAPGAAATPGAAAIPGAAAAPGAAARSGVSGPAGTGDPALSPQPGMAQIPALLDRVRAAGLPVELSVDAPAQPQAALPPGLDLAAYRVVQEALTNVLKHAGQARTAVRIQYRPSGLLITVSDDGSPPDSAPDLAPGQPSGPGGRGLIGLRERIAVYGGELDAGPRPGGGWRLAARIPLDPLAAKDGRLGRDLGAPPEFQGASS